MQMVKETYTQPYKEWTFWAKTVVVAIAFWVLLAADWTLSRSLVEMHLTVLQKMRLTDLGDLRRYSDANAALPTDPDRVVFFGDSITYQWNLARFFSNQSYLNRGIGGEATADMLVRFRQDVINLHPKVVVILGGINDFAEQNLGGNLAEERKISNVASNIETMAELSAIHGIRPVFLSVLPINDYDRLGWQASHLVSSHMIIAHNDWLQKYCAENHYLYIDVFSSMVDERGKLRREFSDDGLHPNDAGYKVMAAVFAKNFHG